jgi:biotin synthase
MDDTSLLKIFTNGYIKKDIIGKILLFKGREQRNLFKLAQQKRSEYFPSEEVEVRSVIEISNICQRKCNFCNINSYAKRKRYIIKYEDLIKIVEYLYHIKKRRVLLFQSGENRSRKYIDFVCKVIRNIKQKFNDLKVILCLGSLSYNQYRELREAGADRYILKFETSNPLLYRQIKPDDSLEKRIECLNMLIELGFEVGTGNIIGLPNQTLEDIVNDLLFIRNFKLSMVSTSVFIPGEASSYRNKPIGDLNITLNFMALMRIMYPQMLIPSTSSLEKAKRGGQYLGLMAGANTVTIHDGTPKELKRYYPIYSVKRFIPTEKYIKNIVTKAHLHFNLAGTSHL